MMMTLAKPPGTQRRSMCLNMALDATGDTPVIRVFRVPFACFASWACIIGRVIRRNVSCSTPCLVPARPGQVHCAQSTRRPSHQLFPLRHPVAYCSASAMPRPRGNGHHGLGRMEIADSGPSRLAAIVHAFTPAHTMAAERILLHGPPCRIRLAIAGTARKNG